MATKRNTARNCRIDTSARAANASATERRSSDSAPCAGELASLGSDASHEVTTSDGAFDSTSAAPMAAWVASER